ncbi:RagB/SusD family nutrient uptake outer membrane protein [Chitinophaga silvatica]|uniref:RagB/SusD family nutrient uptake outer membrane protein n=1 Tax=Chitinophaga silvatica TaxID=2282649 RepID=A0A3E1Y3V6_9BACT|nr:RagB/SusD family nutrient uptake outer membrane protein [Chitinophaga silvatica]RFS19343.1 RagB/SusD family nutrient uptake outer membrane protein [Chitinophaga silvatica]
MKKFIIIFSVITGLFACQKQLDLPSDGRLTNTDIFNNYDRVKAYLNSCYGFCPSPVFERTWATDEAQDANIANASSTDSRNWYQGAVTSINYGSISVDGDPWTNLFTGIRKVNNFLANIGASRTIAGEDEKNSWIAQAHTLRALYYLQLIKRYGDVPKLDSVLSVGHDFSKDKKNKFNEIVTLILADCDAALKFPVQRMGFPWDIYENQYGIMSRAVAYAIKSEAVLYAASPLWSDGTYSWEQAKQITAEALSQCLANDYKLFSEVPATDIAQNAYALYHLIGSNDRRSRDKETILHIGGQLQIWKNAGLPSNLSVASAGSCPTQEMVDKYEMINGEAPITGYSDGARLNPIINPASNYDPANPYVNRDPRFYASIYYNGAVRNLASPASKIETAKGGKEGISQTDNKRTPTGYYMRKFNSNKSTSTTNLDGSIRLFRLAELYLNFAEAANQAVGPDVAVTIGTFSMSARDAISAVRSRAGMPAFPAGMSKENFEKKYRNERAVELAFEGHRYFDVRRWKILDQTDKFVTGMEITNDAGTLTYKRFKFEDRNCFDNKFLLYPINQTEVDKVKQLTGISWQNPGW